MLAAFEVGVKGGKWFSLMDKIFSMQNLKEAFAQVKANRGSARVDHQSMAQIGKHLEANLQDIHTRLKEGRHYPQLIRRVWIPKPGCKEKRPLGIPTVRDRVDQTALRNVIEPIFKRDFSDRSYGFRPALGCKHALRCVYVLLQRGYTYVVDADIKSYFDTIPHASLLSLKAYLGQGVIETVSEWRPDKGTPQGAVISPLLANIIPLLQPAFTARDAARHADHPAAFGYDVGIPRRKVVQSKIPPPLVHQLVRSQSVADFTPSSVIIDLNTQLVFGSRLFVLANVMPTWLS